MTVYIALLSSVRTRICSAKDQCATTIMPNSGFHNIINYYIQNSHYELDLEICVSELSSIPLLGTGIISILYVKIAIFTQCLLNTAITYWTTTLVFEHVETTPQYLDVPAWSHRDATDPPTRALAARLYHSTPRVRTHHLVPTPCQYTMVA